MCGVDLTRIDGIHVTTALTNGRHLSMLWFIRADEESPKEKIRIFIGETLSVPSQQLTWSPS